jgi:ParB family chromosome partitioning protein
MNPPKMKGLGRGLDALLAANNTPEAQRQDTLPVGLLQPGKYQPRTRMDPGSLEELADSIKAQGLIQPISVRPICKTAGVVAMKSLPANGAGVRPR